MTPEYSTMSQDEQRAELDRLNELRWDIQDELAAVNLCRAALMNIMKGEA